MQYMLLGYLKKKKKHPKTLTQRMKNVCWMEISYFWKFLLNGSKCGIFDEKNLYNNFSLTATWLPRIHLWQISLHAWKYPAKQDSQCWEMCMWPTRGKSQTQEEKYNYLKILPRIVEKKPCKIAAFFILFRSRVAILILNRCKQCKISCKLQTW